MGVHRLELVPLTEAPDGQRSAVADLLDDQDITDVLGIHVVDALERRRRSDVAGRTRHLLVFDAEHGAVGWAGWLFYQGRPGTVETTTYLGVPWWGTGVNADLKMLQHQVARSAGVRLVASVRVGNIRSRRAVEKLWPGATCETVEEQWKPRDAWVFSLDGEPNAGRRWPGDVIQAEAEAVRGLHS